MKKLIALLVLAFVVAAASIGCGGPGTTPSGGTAPKSTGGTGHM